MSHVKNVEAFGKLVGICTGLGGNYNPGHPNLKEESITMLLAQSRAALDAVQLARKDFVNAVNKREAEFEHALTLAQRALNDLRSSGALGQTIEPAKRAYRKLVGYRISRDPVEGEALPEGSATGRKARGGDYITRVESFDMFVKLLAAEPTYNPGIAELKVPALQEMLTAMIVQNTNVNEAKHKLEKAREVRNKVLYGTNGSMTAIGKAMKFQLRALHGVNSDAYKPASRIILKNGS